MEIVPWKPFRELEAIRRDMERIWNRFAIETPIPKFLDGGWLPPLSISEDKDHIIVKAELPGMEIKDIDISISGNFLTIKGEKKEEKKKEGERYHYSETYHGSFQRSFQLPVRVQGEKAEATFDKGVLKITLPKTEEAKTKEIKVTVH